jgi:hypothetical protein
LFAIAAEVAMRRYSQRLSLAGEKNQLYIESMTKQEKLMVSL